MYLVRTIAEVRERMAKWRAAGRRVALVPTMGNLHRGHLTLVAAAAGCADEVAVSIFVNPLQFDDERDLRVYPRTLEADLEALQAQNVGLAFTPDREEMYPSDRRQDVYVDPGDIGAILCGADRPGHFVGVATVAVKLFNVFQPDAAVFGEKDYQQLVLIKRLVQCLNFGVRIVAVPTVREASGLALSSRNEYLDEEQKRRAATLYRALHTAATALGNEGELTAMRRLLDAARAEIESAGLSPDYVELRDSYTLEAFDSRGAVSGSRIILGAARIGKARLIDNVLVDEAPSMTVPRKC